MKKAAKPNASAIQGAAERIARGAARAGDDLRKDKPDQDSAEPAEASDGTQVVLRQRRRPRGRTA